MARVLNVEWTGQNQTTALAAEQDGGNKMKKYEFTGEVKRIKLIGTEVVLRRIRAVTAFGGVEAGDIGGWIEKEENLSHDGSAWVHSSAWVYGNARVYGDARVCGNAEVCGDAMVHRTNHVFLVGPIGSRNDSTTFYRNIDGQIDVKCGCFNGNIEVFLEKVTQTHENNQHASAYRAVAQVAKMQIKTNGFD